MSLHLASFESPNIQRISGIQLVPPWLNHWSVVLGRHHLLEWLPCFQLHEPLHWLLGQPSSRARISRWSKGLGVVIAEQWFPLPLENRVFVKQTTQCLITSIRNICCFNLRVSSLISRYDLYKKSAECSYMLLQSAVGKHPHSLVPKQMSGSKWANKRATCHTSRCPLPPVIPAPLLLCAWLSQDYSPQIIIPRFGLKLNNKNLWTQQKQTRLLAT